MITLTCKFGLINTMRDIFCDRTVNIDFQLSIKETIKRTNMEIISTCSKIEYKLHYKLSIMLSYFRYAISLMKISVPL